MTTTELTQKQITSNVANRIEEMKGEGLLVAPNYSVSNALANNMLRNGEEVFK